MPMPPQDAIHAAAQSADAARLARAADEAALGWRGEAEAAALIGGAYKLLGDERAGIWLERALAADPGSPRHGWNLAFWHLSRMEFALGFAIAQPIFQGWVRDLYPQAAHLPFLDRGAPLEARRVLALADGGIGDALMWARWMKPLAAKAGRAGLMLGERCQGLAPLLAANGIEIAHFAEGYDCALPQGLIPWVMERHPIISPEGYLKADARRAAYWQERLPSPFAALAWRGSGTLEKDPFRCRDLSLDALLAKLPEGMAAVSLQESLLPAEEGRGLIHLPSPLEDKAAILTLAQHVLLTDSAQAHLAGALGCKARLFLAFSPCWRWFGGHSPSPWYGGLELVRRERPGRA
jgi:hypothetical protein